MQKKSQEVIKQSRVSARQANGPSMESYYLVGDLGLFFGVKLLNWLRAALCSLEPFTSTALIQNAPECVFTMKRLQDGWCHCFSSLATSARCQERRHIQAFVQTERCLFRPAFCSLRRRICATFLRTAAAPLPKLRREAAVLGWQLVQ